MGPDAGAVRGRGRSGRAVIEKEAMLAHKTMRRCMWNSIPRTIKYQFRQNWFLIIKFLDYLLSWRQYTSCCPGKSRFRRPQFFFLQDDEIVSSFFWWVTFQTLNLEGPNFCVYIHFNVLTPNPDPNRLHLWKRLWTYTHTPLSRPLP